METEPNKVPFNVLSDTYHVWVPIEDHDLLKSVSIDENGDFIVQGVISSDDMDEEDDSITPEGMDCSYFLTKGWIKYEHGNQPNQFIGEPLEVRVGQFEHPTTLKAVSGIFVKGKLFASREMTRQAVQTIEDLQKSNTKRRMGWSIEGNVKERCRKTGKVLKSILRNVVLTMNPVNTVTWAELAKSFAKNHEVEVNMELDKSMDVSAIAEVMPQSIEGTKVQTADPQEEWVKLFRKFVKDNALNKSLRKQFVTSTEGEVGINSYIFAKQNGLAYDEACEFASYIAERQEILKSLMGKIGGETMSQEEKSNLAKLLDSDLDELQKSLEMDDETSEEETEELNKSHGEKEDDSEDTDSDDDSDNDDSDDDEEEDDDEEMEKSASSELRKSLEEDHGQAFEVTEFLGAWVDEVGFNLEGLQKSMGNMTKQQTVLVKSLASVVTVVREMTQQLEEVKTENVELRKSLGEVLERPVGRKSVVNNREATTLTKSLGDEGNGKPLNRKQTQDVLEKSFEKGDLKGSEIARFEAGVPLNRLNLPESVKTQLGME
jgi:hypothetical protein